MGNRTKYSKQPFQIRLKDYFVFVIFMLIASTYLRVLFNNLPPILRSHHVWTIIWGISIVAFKPSILFNKVTLYLLIYGIFLIVGLNTFWRHMDDWNMKFLLNELYHMSVGITVISYFRKTNDYVSLAKITKWALVFIFITAIMSIISFMLNPMYARDLTAVTLAKTELERNEILSFKQYGGGTYSTAIVFMSLLPVLIYRFRYDIKQLGSKNLLLLLIIIFIVALFGMQIFANIIISILFILISLLGVKRIKYSIFTIGFFLLIAIILPLNTYSNALRNIGNQFNQSSLLNYKFNDAADFVELGAINNRSTAIGERATRYQSLFRTFQSRPFLGYYYGYNLQITKYNEEDAHLFWMNKIAITGIIGLFLFLTVLVKNTSMSLKYINSNYTFYYLLALSSIIIYGFMKVVVGRETWYAIIIILPGIYYLPLLRNSEKSIKANTFRFRMIY